MPEPDCEKCGLRDLFNGPVPDDGDDYSILLVGESPGIEEDTQGKPFVGRSGQLLRNALNQVGYPMDKVTFTNIVKCHPPENDTKPKYVKCCYQSLPIKENTKLVILAGNVPLKAVLGEKGITTWNGVRVERDGIIYAPVLHPAYLLRNRNRDLMDDWIEALDDALYAYDNGAKLPADHAYTYLYPETLSEVKEMIRELEESDDCISFDIEFSYLDAYKKGNRINVISFANHAKAWALPIEHPEMDSQAKLVTGEYVIPLIRKLLRQHPTVIGHNIKMDQMQMDVLLGIKFDAAGDSMLASYVVDTQTGIHSLKRLAGYYLGMFEYDAELQSYVNEHPEADPRRPDGSYANIPLQILLPYAARDAAATYLLEDILIQKMTEQQQNLYYELMVPTSNALYRMQVNGMVVDHKVADRYRRLYRTARKTTLEHIQEDAQVQRYVSKRKEEKPNFQFNPNSYPQRAAVLYDYYGLKPLGRTAKGAASTKAEYLEPYKDECSLAADLVRSSMLTKMLGTYIEPVALGTRLSGDGKNRSSFNQHITVSGRLSSSGFSKYLGFNQQNLPNPDRAPGTILAYEPIRSMFTHTWKGGIFLSLDYSQLEVRMMASLAKCYAMLDILESGEDFHTMVAATIHSILTEEVSKHQRTMAKSITFALQYGGDEYTISQQAGTSIEEAKKILSSYFQRFPEIKDFMQSCVAFARKNGYIENPFGLRSPLSDIDSGEYGKRAHAEREAANIPVQGGAGMLTLLALLIIDGEMQKHDFRSMLVNTVHDSIATDVYPGELDKIVALQVDIMENLKDWAVQYAPHIDLSWLICSLKADVEVGSHYGNMSKYEPENGFIAVRDVPF